MDSGKEKVVLFGGSFRVVYHVPVLKLFLDYSIKKSLGVLVWVEHTKHERKMFRVRHIILITIVFL